MVSCEDRVYFQRGICAILKEMSNFEYKAIDKKKKLFSGSIESPSAEEVKNILSDKGLKVLVIKEKKENGVNSFLKKKGKFSTLEKINLCRYFSVLINAGLPLGESLDLLVKSSDNSTTKIILQSISSSVRKGLSISESFAKFPQYFSEVFIAMIKAGEVSGALNQSFEFLAKQLKQEDDLKRKVISALIYPLMIVCLMFGVLLIMLTFVLPRLAKVFLTMKVELPLITNLMLKFSLFLEKRLLLFGIVFSVLIIGIIVIFTSKKGKKFLYSILEKIPLIKKILFYYNLARFNQTLSILLKSGVTIEQALEISLHSMVISNREEIEKQLSEKIVKGVTLSTIFSETGFFPPLMNGMLIVGERSGSLDKTLAEAATFYKEEVENSLNNFIAILEPLLVVLVGIGVGVMIVSFISPIYGLISKIGPS